MLDNTELLSKISQDLQERFNLSATEVADIFLRSVVNSISKGDFVFKQGVKSPFLFFIAEGRAEVIRDNQIIAEVKHGDIIGEMSILGNGKATATVIALSDLKVFKFLKDKFNVVLNKYPSLNKAVVRKAINVKIDKNEVVCLKI